MKAFTIVLGLLCAGLVFGLYKRGASADADAAAAVKLQETLTNQVLELRTKLMMEQGTSGHTVSNLQYLLSRRDASLTFTSNRLVQANLLVKTAQIEARAAQAELPSKAAQMALLEGERDELARRLAVVPSLEKQIADLRTKMGSIASDREFLYSEVRRLELEKADLDRKMEDASLLRAQLAKVEEDMELKRRLLKAGTSASVSSRARLELQDDGTVRPLLPIATQAKK